MHCIPILNLWLMTEEHGLERKNFDHFLRDDFSSCHSQHNKEAAATEKKLDWIDHSLVYDVRSSSDERT
jgi:hypothetical protein